MRWFRGAAAPYQLALAMIDAKPGDQVLVAGAGDGGLAAELARTTGLNGQTLVVDPAPGARERVALAAVREGALVEFDAAPFSARERPEASAQLVIFNHALAGWPAWERPNACGEALRVLRPGGRLIVLERARRSGLVALLRAPGEPLLPGEEIVTLASRAGFRAARILSESDGVLFVEAAKPRS
jgi:ubiquinone/menaquinone biosynthesis C-methylase UbiE